MIACAKTLPPKTQPKLVPNTTQCKHWTLVLKQKLVPNTTQCKHWSLVPKFYHLRLNPNLYPTPHSVNTERSCQNFNTHRLLYWRLADSKSMLYCESETLPRIQKLQKWTSLISGSRNRKNGAISGSRNRQNGRQILYGSNRHYQVVVWCSIS